MLDKFYLGQSLSDLDIGEKTTKISRVNLLVDGQTMYTAGNDTGRTIEKNVPWASQGMANDLLEAIKNVEYQPFSGVDALVDPSAEIGDGITVGGIYSVLAQKNISYGRMSTSSIAAPESDEIDDEYPYISKKQREDNRKLAQTYSYIAKTSEEIKFGVANDLKNMRSEIDIQLDKITLSVQDAEKNISSIEQYAKSLTLSVSNGSTSSTIKLMAGSTEIDSENITFSGFVTFNGLSGGTTSIDGACIKTGTIDAERINLTGAITFNDLSSSLYNQVNNSITSSEAKTLITSTLVAAPTINGAVLHNYQGNGWLELVDGSNAYGDLALYGYRSSSGQKWETFRIHDRVGSADLDIYRNTILTGNQSGVFAKGTWDFSGATVSGVKTLVLAQEESDETKKEIGLFGAEPEQKNKVELSEENGILKIKISGATWYLDSTGLHQRG